MRTQTKTKYGTGRTFLTGAAILLLMVMGCDNATSPNHDLTGSNDALVSMDSGDAVNVGHEAIYTTDGFYFLAPMVKDYEYSGIFDGGLSPVVEICETTTCEIIHASFDMDGDGSERIRVDEDAEHYIVNWNTNSRGAEAGQTYRIRVVVAGTTLGHADVAVVSSGRDAVQVRSDGLIALVANQTLPVTFRIETGIPGAVVVSPAEATIDVGETQQFTAALYDLHGEPLVGPVITWSSDAPDVATVDTEGLASGLEVGEAIMTASAGVKSGSAVLTVENQESEKSNIIEDFESGNLDAYTFTGSVDAVVAEEYAHDGEYGLGIVGTGWIYRNDEDVNVKQGDIISVWIMFDSIVNGRGYFGFGATEAGTLSFVVAPNTGDIRFQENNNYNYKELSRSFQAFEVDKWYRAEVVWGTDGSLTGNLYDSDGETLLNSVSDNSTLFSEGGIAFRGFDGVKAFDTVEVFR